ncbi:conserved hypothetical protein [Neospora caninum Liverpool]|nr:conserved hypothetical protein [Neospora caninum Liverpool]CBZ52130.1 conserved hypothetical protein [Neospora caninum Liverpool]|eukprot:XP_003882162.1 conserved hypothetical protein [Neospora caninum Liverpool]
MAMTISSPSSFSSAAAPHSPTASGEASPRGVSCSFFSQTPYTCASLSSQLASCRSAVSPSLAVPDSSPLSPASYQNLQLSSSQPARPSSSLSASRPPLAASVQVPSSASFASFPGKPSLPFPAVAEVRKRSTGEELTRRLLADWAVSAKASKKGVVHEGTRPKQGSRSGIRNRSGERHSSASSFPSSCASSSPGPAFPCSSPAPHHAASNVFRPSRSVASPPAAVSDSPFSSSSDSPFSSCWWTLESPRRQQDLSRVSVVQAVLSNQTRGKFSKRSEAQIRNLGDHATPPREAKREDEEAKESFRLRESSWRSKEGPSVFEKKRDSGQSGTAELGTNQSWNSFSASPSLASQEPLSSASRAPSCAASNSSSSLPGPLGGVGDSRAVPENAKERRTRASERREGKQSGMQCSAVDTPEDEKEADLTESQGELVLWEEEGHEAKDEGRLCGDEHACTQQMQLSDCDKTDSRSEDATKHTRRRDEPVPGQQDFFGARVPPEEEGGQPGLANAAAEIEEREGTVSRVLQILRCQTLIRDAQAALRAVGVSPELLVDPEGAERFEEASPVTPEASSAAGERAEGGSGTVNATSDACIAEARREKEEEAKRSVQDCFPPGEEEVLMCEREEEDAGKGRKRSAWMRGEKSEGDLHDDPAVQALRALLPSLVERCPDWIDEKLNVGRRGEWIAFTKILPEILERRYDISVSELRKDGPYCWMGRGRRPPDSTLLSQGSLPCLSLASCSFSSPSLCTFSSCRPTGASSASSSLSLEPGRLGLAPEGKADEGFDSPLSFFSPASTPGNRSEAAGEIEAEQERADGDTVVDFEARWINGCTETGLPYDIRIDMSSDTHRESIFLEVKATVLGCPSFFLSAPEVRFARSQRKSFVVLSLWNVRSPRGPSWALIDDVGTCEGLPESLLDAQSAARSEAREERGESEKSERGEAKDEKANCDSRQLRCEDGDNV